VTEPPIDDPDGSLDPPDGAQLPGAEDGPMQAPPDELVPSNDGDLDVGDPPDGGQRDDEVLASSSVMS